MKISVHTFYISLGNVDYSVSDFEYVYIIIRQGA